MIVGATNQFVVLDNGILDIIYWGVKYDPINRTM